MLAGCWKVWDGSQATIHPHHHPLRGVGWWWWLLRKGLCDTYTHTGEGVGLWLSVWTGDDR